MFPVFPLSDRAYLRADRICCVCEYAASPKYTNALNCELVEPKFSTRSRITLSNGMELFSDRPLQELQSAVAKAAQAYDVPTSPVALNDLIAIDPAYIIAILPYNAQICDHVEEHGYDIHKFGRASGSLIVMDGDTCLAVKDTPSELLSKLNAPRQA